MRRSHVISRHRPGDAPSADSGNEPCFGVGAFGLLYAQTIPGSLRLPQTPKGPPFFAQSQHLILGASLRPGVALWRVCSGPSEFAGVLCFGVPGASWSEPVLMVRSLRGLAGAGLGEPRQVLSREWGALAQPSMGLWGLLPYNELATLYLGRERFFAVRLPP